MKLGALILVVMITFLSWLVYYIPRSQSIKGLGLLILAYLHLIVFRSFLQSRKERRCGYKGHTLTTMKLRKTCQDIDECKEYAGMCPGTLHCTNTEGGFICG